MKHIHQIKHMTVAAMSVAALTVTFLATGCAHTISKTEETHVSGNGTVRQTEKTVTQNPDGTINQTEVRKTTRP
jgi:hypothetical protein